MNRHPLPDLTLEGTPVILALIDALLRPLLTLVLATCVVVIVAVARDTLSTAYPEPRD